MSPAAIHLEKAQRDSNGYHLVYSVPRLVGTRMQGFGSTVEVVAVRGIVSDDKERGHDAICISVSTSCYQVPGCRYCATGMVSEQAGIQNVKLTTDELAAQVTQTLAHVRSYEEDFGNRGLSVSFMGKGEPGLYPHLVMDTLQALYDGEVITQSSLSTTGLPGCLRNLAEAYRKQEKAFPAPYLQVSIHSPLETQRRSLVTKPEAQAPLEAVLTSAVEDYALPVLNPGTFVTLRLTLMKWDHSQRNFDPASIDELSRLITSFDERYSSSGFGGFVVVAALLNETGSSRTQNIHAATEADLEAVIGRLRSKGVRARIFSGSIDKSRAGPRCGTFADTTC